MALRVLALQHAPSQSNPSRVAVSLAPHAPLQSHPLRVSVPSLVHFLVAAPDPKRLEIGVQVFVQSLPSRQSLNLNFKSGPRPLDPQPQTLTSDPEPQVRRRHAHARGGAT